MVIAAGLVACPGPKSTAPMAAEVGPPAQATTSAADEPPLPPPSTPAVAPAESAGDARDAPASSSSVLMAQFEKLPTPKLASEFRAIRARGYGYEGRFEVTKTLGERLARERHTRAELVLLLGPPDADLRGDDAVSRAVELREIPTSERELLVYRVLPASNGEEVLFVICRKGAVVRVGWYDVIRY